ncbi:phage tail assembly protein [Streptomyces chumphonensis]|uniref:phage tail assembly protein n=1 Tax=Streptomyces chumphonensis TaxID=1214925 RepID=UPI003D719093
MPKIADLQREAHTKYTDLPLELEDGTVVELRNLLRLDDKARKTAQVLLAAMEEDKGEQIEGSDALDQLTHQENVLRDLFLLVADKPEALRPEVDRWDLALKLYVLEMYTEGTQAGEASSSPS